MFLFYYFIVDFCSIVMIYFIKYMIINQFSVRGILYEILCRITRTYSTRVVFLCRTSCIDSNSLFDIIIFLTKMKNTQR